MKAQGVKPIVGQLVIERDQEQCVARVTHPGKAAPGEQIHHRKPRRMGGTTQRSTNGVTNLIYLCRPCHEWIENNRDLSTDLGWLLRASQSPTEAPLLYRGVWSLLRDDGTISAA